MNLRLVAHMPFGFHTDPLACGYQDRGMRPARLITTIGVARFPGRSGGFYIVPLLIFVFGAEQVAAKRLVAILLYTIMVRLIWRAI